MEIVIFDGNLNSGFMKKNRFLPSAFALIVMVLSLTGCVKYIDDSVILGGCQVSAKVDGEKFCGDGYYIYDEENGVLTINASDNNGGQVITLYTEEGTLGTFELNFDSQSGAYYTDGSATSYSINGTLTITNYSEKKVSGMFNFDAQPASGGTVRKITNGMFSVKRVGTN